MLIRVPKSIVGLKYCIIGKIKVFIRQSFQTALKIVIFL